MKIKFINTVCKIIVFSIVLGLTGCTPSKESKTLNKRKYEQYKEQYNNDGDRNTLAEILVYAYESANYGDMEKYGKRFFSECTVNEQDYFLKCLYSYPNFSDMAEETVDYAFDICLWQYVVLSLYNDNYTELMPTITEAYTALKQVFNRFRTSGSTDRYLCIESAISALSSGEVLNTNGLKEKMFNLLNLFSQETSVEEQEKIYPFLSIKYAESDNEELYNYFFKYVSTPIINATEKRGIENDGKIKSDFNTLNKIINLITSEKCGFDEICDYFGVVPRNVNGNGTLLVYYSSEYTVFINGLPAYSACIIKTSSGEIMASATAT